ncbi:MAG: hypothetical protein K2X03_01755 [Bryobacteraceae bacterium]|nr:hypothetical protein [Bryobacteraceae bacterium]
MRLPATVFLVVLTLLFLLEGSRVVFTNDEGIILEAAQRMARGERLYVDFFGYMSPGGYWLQSLAFRGLGISLAAARAVVFTDFALQSAVLAWLVRRWASRRAAILAVVIFVGLHVPQPGLLTAQHRWDSAALAMLSAAFVTGGWFALAGACAAMAAICTPSVGLVTVVTVTWLAYRRAWTDLPRYLGGALGAGLAALLILVVSGNAGGFFAQMQWLREHYSAVNVMAYGSIMGGWGALLPGWGPEALVSGVLLVGLALPALLPVLVVPWGIWRARTEPGWGYLALVVLALVASAYPRADVMHLAFFVSLPLALGTVLIAQQRWAGYVAVGLSVIVLLYGAGYAAARWRESRVPSVVGTLRTSAPELGDMLARVRPGAGLYVHPYMPLFYFLTQAKNPTRYSYLNPGMMAAEEERQTLADLEQRPPEWVLYLPLSREEFLRVFPSATGLDERYRLIEAWIERHYVAAGVTVSGYQLRQRRYSP